MEAMPAPVPLAEVVALLAAAVVAVPVFKRLGLGSVLGYLAAGVAVGPWGLDLVGDVRTARAIAEFGVVFLLFVIGIELKPARLWLMRRLVFGLGTAQVAATGALLSAAAAWLLGVAPAAAVVIGFGLSLSSTAFGLQILTDRGEMNTAHGRAAFGVLLFQDIAVVPLLALLPLLGDAATPPAGAVAMAALKVIAVVGGVVLAGRFLLRPALHLVAGSRMSEVFAAAAVLVVLGAGWLMELAGLSVALGAFLAGLLLSDSEFRHQVQADIQPFRGFLLGLFFMAVGMSIDFGVLGAHGAAVAGVVGGLIAVKATLLWPLGRLFGIGAGGAARLALLLAQSGEFAFVLFGFAVPAGILTADAHQALVLAVALTMAVTPALVTASAWLARTDRDHERRGAVTEPTGLDAGKVIVAGFGRVGETVTRMLAARAIPYAALDIAPDRVAQARAHGYSVFYGDASRADVLKAVGADAARLVVVTLDQPGAAERAVASIRHHYPGLPILARAHDLERSRDLRRLGASGAVPETLEASLQLGAAALRVAGCAGDEVAKVTEDFRAADYGLFENLPAPRPDATRDT